MTVFNLQWSRQNPDVTWTYPVTFSSAVYSISKLIYGSTNTSQHVWMAEYSVRNVNNTSLYTNPLEPSAPLCLIVIGK